MSLLPQFDRVTIYTMVNGVKTVRTPSREVAKALKDEHGFVELNGKASREEAVKVVYNGETAYIPLIAGLETSLESALAEEVKE